VCAQSAKRQLEDRLATMDREADEARAKQEALKKALEVTGACSAGMPERSPVVAVFEAGGLCPLLVTLTRYLRFSCAPPPPPHLPLSLRRRLERV
jgi:hypothetical protein